MAYRWIAMETAALERRLEAVPSFSTTIPMVGAAVPAARALSLADSTVHRSKRVLRRQLQDSQHTIATGERGATALAGVHRRFIGLRHRFHALLGTVDVFSDALTQRSEHRVGVLLRGLDALAHDGLRTRIRSFEAPPVVCYLDRGVGGAVRRAFTRLPGGERNAIALVRLPRERLSGIGLASLLHEVGHQGVASLGLAAPYRRALHEAGRTGALSREASAWWSTKITEILPDAWACAKVGAAATLGLFGVLSSLTRLVFHDERDDPHPMPYLRGLFSAAFGAEIFPSPIWGRLAALWRVLHPLPDDAARPAIERLAGSVAGCARAIAALRPESLESATLLEAVGDRSVAPSNLGVHLDDLSTRLRVAPSTLRPCVALAVAGLGRIKGRIAPGAEHGLLDGALRVWAETQSR